MNWFLDMCILISYAEPADKFHNKVNKFINSKGADYYLACCYIIDENLPKWIKRKKVALLEIKRSLENSSYIIGTSTESNILYKEDIADTKKILNYVSTKYKYKSVAYNKVKINQDILINNLNYFIKKFIDKKVVPVKEIDFELRSSLFSYLTPNDSDAKTLASGIQYRQIENLVLFTGDKNDWTKELLESAIVYHPTLNKKYSKIPEIKYIQEM
ncbi:MAG: hypothetical protein AABX94_03375 [Nanoarchaeota archaeon]